MTTHQAARLISERNLARPGLRRIGLECKNTKSFPDKDKVLKPTTRDVNKAYDLRTRKTGSLKPSAINGTAAGLKPKENKLPKNDKIDKLVKKLNNISVEDIDADDRSDPLLCSEYVNDIYVYMRKMEQVLAVDPNYMSKKTDITERMRGILIDWLIQVHLKFKLLQETLYLTVAILDKYLSVTDIKRDRLQLVGVTSMLIASKFEEIYAPEVNDFVYITDHAYTDKNILDMEIKILNKLEFDLNHPLPLHFLRRYSKAGNADGKVHTLGKYLMELCLPSLPMLRFKPSEIAAGAFLVAQHVLMPDRQWGTTLTHYTQHTRAQALVVAKAIADLVVRAEKSKLQAVRNKFNSPKFMSVSHLDSLDRVHDLLQE